MKTLVKKSNRNLTGLGIVVLVLLTVARVFSACSKDDEPEYDNFVKFNGADAQITGRAAMYTLGDYFKNGTFGYRVGFELATATGKGNMNVEIWCDSKLDIETKRTYTFNPMDDGMSGTFSTFDLVMPDDTGFNNFMVKNGTVTVQRKLDADKFYMLDCTVDITLSNGSKFTAKFDGYLVMY
jgi:hypothetical protein